MNLIAPQNFAFAALIGAILLLYVLRLKRKERVVSSTLLWQTALRDLQANAPWQRLRSSLLMWLQIAFIVLATLALVRPSIKVLASGGQTVAIILDASGSMAANDVRPSRFEKARAEASRLINDLSSGDSATVIAAAAQTRVLAPLTADKGSLKRAVAGARTQDTSCNLREAVVLATSLLRGKRNSRIYILSDGAVPPLNEAPGRDVNVQFVRIGTGNDNLAITAMDVRRPYVAEANAQIFVTVQNFSSRQRTINLELSHDGNLAAVRPMIVPARGQTSQLFDDLNFKQGLFGVRFDADDALASDNAAYATLAAPQNIKVLLLSEGNLFLEKALGLDPNVEVFRATGGAVPTTQKAAYDVIVCDGVAPASLPAANQLVFNAITDLSPVVKTGIVAQPKVADYDRKHPVSRYASWNDVKLGQALAVQLKPWGRPIVEAERTPLVVAGERGERRVVWCGFDLRDTDLPLRVAFPIFITNALHWLSGSRAATGAEGAARRAGEAVPLDVPPGVREITVTAPDKTSQRVPITALPLAYSGADQAGLYTATAGSGQSAWTQTFAVNLLNKDESDLQPRDALQVNGGKAVAAESTARANRELWSYLALAALALLGVEWWIYHRGV